MSDQTIPAQPKPGTQTFRLVDASKAGQSGGGCGCGGHGGGNGGGCGCGGHGHGGNHQHAHQHAATAAARAAGNGGNEELRIHSIPRVVRHALLFHAMDILPIGSPLVIVAPHQPDPLFDHLQRSDFHYRVETLDAGPEDWRYRITRLS